jgi:hypothetical protein
MKPMQSQPQPPSQSYVWSVLSLRFEIELTRHKLEICRLCGLSEEFGAANDNLTREENRLIDELSGILVQAIALEALQMAYGTGGRVGRPRDVMMPFLGPELLSIYLRCNDSGGRTSVATWIDGKPGQTEAGPLLDFIKAAIERLNNYLTTSLHRRLLSASRVARFALSERQKVAKAAGVKSRKKKPPSQVTN